MEEENPLFFCPTLTIPPHQTSQPATHPSTVTVSLRLLFAALLEQAREILNINAASCSCQAEPSPPTLALHCVQLRRSSALPPAASPPSQEDHNNVSLPLPRHHHSWDSARRPQSSTGKGVTREAAVLLWPSLLMGCLEGVPKFHAEEIPLLSSE